MRGDARIQQWWCVAIGTQTRGRRLLSLASKLQLEIVRKDAVDVFIGADIDAVLVDALSAGQIEG